jgi:putative ABC transport system permease protein
MALVPLKYTVRNLWVRRATTILTILVTAISVATTCVMFGLIEGLLTSNQVSGDPLDVIVLRKGASAETAGGFNVDTAREIETLEGIARAPVLTEAQKASHMPDLEGGPLLAGELVTIRVITKANNTKTNIILRGAAEASPHLRRDFQIIAGRYLTPGTRECMISPSMVGKYRGAQLGDRLVTGESESYEVVGLFTAGGSAAESEVWVDRDVLARELKAEGAVNSVQLRAASAQARDAVMQRITSETRLGLSPMTETKFFADQQFTAIMLTVIGTLIGIAMSTGAIFAAANTMFAAVKSRTREIGTLRALGFPRRAILMSFLGEALLIAIIGGVVGCLSTLLFRSWSFAILDFNTFADRSFQLKVGPLVLAVALAMTLAMGVFGGLFPALRAVRLDVVKSLREV